MINIERRKFCRLRVCGFLELLVILCEKAFKRIYIMKKAARNILFLVSIPLLFFNCNGQKEPQGEEEPTGELAPVPVLPDSAFYGRLGEGTGMSCLQLITGGDTLTWIKTNEETGESGLILGEIENYSDSFSVTTCGRNEYVAVALNISELIEKDWRKGIAEKCDTSDGFRLKAGGEALRLGGGKEEAFGYSLYNCQLVFIAEEEAAKDTFDICFLSKGRLTLRGKARGDTLDYRLDKKEIR